MFEALREPLGFFCVFLVAEALRKPVGFFESSKGLKIGENALRNKTTDVSVQ